MNYDEYINKCFDETPSKPKRKHNYPKTRKKGINKNSQKYKLLKKYSLKHIQQTWFECGIYEGARRLGNCNPFVLYHLARERAWRRPLPPHLVKAYDEGCWTITKNYYLEKEENNV